MYRSAVKRLMRGLLGEYSIYRIYTYAALTQARPAPSYKELRFQRIDAALFESSTDDTVTKELAYLGEDSYGYACLDGARVVALCFFWYGERYRSRNFWPLQQGEAKLVQIMTLPTMRARGIARALIAYASADMLNQGFQRLYARIWHSNRPSLRAFQGAGWGQIATVIEMHPLKSRKQVRFVIRSLF